MTHGLEEEEKRDDNEKRGEKSIHVCMMSIIVKQELLESKYH
jgi:hypothetical protein